MGSRDNFIDYLEWRGDLSFDESPFNCVDALIFSQLIYLNYDRILQDPFTNSYTIAQVNYGFRNSSDYKQRCQVGALINGGTPELLNRCSQSRRYSNVKLCGYVNIFDRQREVQFAAATYLLDDKKHSKIITYRGTDDSFLGWKEDFNMSFLDVIPSEEEALKYFQNAAKAFRGKLILAGHSKGGTDAMYAGIFCDKKLQKRIKTIYNFDGPGFSREVLESYAFYKIKDRINSYYPSFSVIGQMFNHDRRYEVIHSNGKNFMQHDPFTWSVSGAKFENDIDFTKESLYFAKTVNDWIQKLTRDEKKHFVDSLFGIFFSSGEETNLGYENNKIKSTAKMISNYKNLDSETRSQISKAITALLSVCKENFPMLNIFNTNKLVTKE